METWFVQNSIGILGIVVGAFIGYHVYFLSKKLDFRGKLDHKAQICIIVEKMLSKIRQGRNSKIEILNVKKYHKYYPHNNEFNRLGYTYLGAELKDLKFDGVECFCEVVELYRRSDGSFSLKSGEGYGRNQKNALKVGVIPYEWIEYVDERGDEFNYRAQIFSRFNGKGKEPYKSYRYYIEREKYDSASEPLGMKYSLIEV